MRAAVALGSNLGDRRAQLRLAREEIRRLPGSGEPFLFSAVYETDPVGCEPGAQKFLNAIVEFEYDGQPHELLRHLRTIERSLGREPDHARNVARTIDLDLLYLGERTIDEAELQVPHPRLHTRRFVLAPLADIRPDLVLPRQKKPIRALLSELANDSAVVRIADEW